MARQLRIEMASEDRLMTIRRISATRKHVATTIFACVLVALVASCVAVPTAGASHGCRVHAAPDVMASWVTGVGSRLEFTDVVGKDWALVTSTSDPAIGYAGSGSFHPASPDVVRSALSEVKWPGMSHFVADIFLLPYPRRELLASSAEAGAIYLSPGVHPFSEGPLHSLTVHELGHLIHQQFLPDTDTEGWRRYRELRGLTDTNKYKASAIHKNRPHEIFAEDFRALFGGARANYSDSIENTELPAPRLVPGLYEFMAGLAGSAAVAQGTPPVIDLAAAPNPFHGSTTIHVERLIDGGGPVLVDILDAAGRLVCHLSPMEEGSDKVGWNGRDASGRPAASGVYYARVVRGAASASTRLVLVR